MADPKTHKRYVAAIEYFETVEPDKVAAHQDYAYRCQASALVADAASGRKSREGGREGGDMKRGTIFERDKKLRKLFFSLRDESSNPIDLSKPNRFRLAKQLRKEVEKQGWGELLTDRTYRRKVAHFIRDFNARP